MKILWTSGTSQSYFENVSGYTLDSWKYLEGDKVIYLDTPFSIPTVPTKITHFAKWKYPDGLNKSEFKFWKKSRSIVSSLENARSLYDYVIWVDGDVEVLQKPNLDIILPSKQELLSAVQKRGKHGTGLDTGFVAFNLRHKNFRDMLFEYTNYWLSDKLDELSFRYDAPVLEKIIEKYNWKNLHNPGELSGKSHCGFEGSLLEPYFMHYWGKKQKINQFS